MHRVYPLPIILLLRALPAVAALCLAATELPAQGGTITAHPDAKLLKRIWMIRGGRQGENVGSSLSPAGDINSDGLADFIVSKSTPLRTMVYLGNENGPSTTATYTLDSCFPVNPSALLGDFWGTKRKAIGLVKAPIIDGKLLIQFRLMIFRTDSNTLPDSPAVTWYSTEKSAQPTTSHTLYDAVPADLDEDGYDDLILGIRGTRSPGQFDSHAKLMIFRGGPDFQVDTPTVVLRDPYPNDGLRVRVADLDGDGHIDIIKQGAYSGRPGYHIYFGDGKIPDSTRQPDREVAIYGDRFFFVDTDGDRKPDILGAGRGAYLYRSGSGKDPRTRSYDSADADVIFVGNGTRAVPLGPLNDSAGRYDMIGVQDPNRSGSSMKLLAFSGGVNGPDHQYEAYFASEYDSELRLGMNVFSIEDGPIGDVDGDGWNEVLCSEVRWPGSNLDYGVAILLSGGPEIPRDSTSSVQDVELEGKRNALSLWPNPVRDELNIAWRGDLTQMPRKFLVHDLLGREIARGEVPAGTPQALWRSGDVSAGTYILSVYDVRDVLIATERIVKE